MSNQLQHSGVKGMRWGIRRPYNRPGGADGKPDAGDSKPRGRVGARLDSMKRERHWSHVLKDLDNMSTKDIAIATKRVSLENNLKVLSKSKVATKKDREDYLRRDKMSDEELTRKVVRLRAKDNLYTAVRSASKEQRELGEKVLKVASSVGMKYASNKLARRRTTQDDLFEAIFVPKKSKDGMVGKVADKVLTKTSLSDENRKKAKELLEKKTSKK